MHLPNVTVAAVYRERVNIHAAFVAKLRERLDGPRPLSFAPLAQ
jgi:hypothetical protein